MRDGDLSGLVVDRRYRLERRLGGGGMGAVYEAEHLATGRRAAVKVVSPALVHSEEAGLRVQREARAAARVESEYIVQVLDVGVDDAVGTWLAMELLYGEDLERRLARERVLSPRDAVEVALQIARALTRAHAASVVHRDLKPANVFLCRNDDRVIRVKVVDFGIAKLLDDWPAAGGALSKAGTIIGTLAYMSPEQAEGRPIDHRTDLWSLGCVLYEMLVGRTPYAHAGQGEQILFAMQREDPPSIARVAPHVPSAVAQVIDALLVRDREHRAADAPAVVRSLERARAALPAEAPVGFAATVVAPAVVAPLVVAPAVVPATLPSGLAIEPTVLHAADLALPAPTLDSAPAARPGSLDDIPMSGPPPATTWARTSSSSSPGSGPRSRGPASAPNARTAAVERALDPTVAPTPEHPLDVAAREQAALEERAGRVRAALVVVGAIVLGVFLKWLLG